MAPAEQHNGKRLPQDHPLSTRMQKLFECLILFAVLLFLLACLFLVRNRTAPDRELSNIPGVKVWSNDWIQPRLRHKVFMIEFEHKEVTPELLKAAVKLPHCYRASFKACQIKPGAAAILARCRLLRQAYFFDCQMDVGEFISACAESESLKSLILEGITVNPGDFRDISRWQTLDYVSLKRSDVEGNALRHIARAPKMKTIDLSETTISDDEITALVEADAFQRIRMRKTDLTESQLEKLCRCRRLEAVNLAKTQLLASALLKLNESKSLKIVDAFETPLGQGFDKKYLPNGCVIYGSGVVEQER